MNPTIFDNDEDDIDDTFDSDEEIMNNHDEEYRQLQNEIDRQVEIVNPEKMPDWIDKLSKDDNEEKKDNASDSQVKDKYEKQNATSKILNFYKLLEQFVKEDNKNNEESDYKYFPMALKYIKFDDRHIKTRKGFDEQHKKDPYKNPNIYILGEYSCKKKEIIIYSKTIESIAKYAYTDEERPLKLAMLYYSTLAHEFMHAEYFYNKLISTPFYEKETGRAKAKRCCKIPSVEKSEETMAEFGALVALFSIKETKFSLCNDAVANGEEFFDAYFKEVKSKYDCESLQHYGRGAFLYDLVKNGCQYSDSQMIEMIQNYKRGDSLQFTMNSL